MNSRLFKLFFSSGIQVVAVQFLGSVFFYVTSLYLTKSDFGLISWSNGVCMTITLLLGFGMEQVVVRRIAASHETGTWISSIYFIHNLFFAILSVVALSILNFHAPEGSQLHLLFYIFIAQSFIFVAVPLKQLLNAKENFTPYAVITFSSNLLKILMILACVFYNAINIRSILIILISTSFLEFISALIYVVTKEKFRLYFKFNTYYALIKVSSHQYLSVIFDAILTRVDWVLLGLLSTKVIVADYSFSYRVYELARLPIFILGPILLPKFTRIATKKIISDDTKKQLKYLFTFMMFLAALIPLCLNIVWGSWIDAITYNKYGRVNAYCFLILSVCVSFHFVINYMWTAFVAIKKFKVISFTLGVCAVINLILNLLLIPGYNKIGAAYAYLFAIIVQTLMFYFYIRKTDFYVSLKPFFLFLFYALVSYLFSKFVSDKVIVQLLLSIFTYIVLIISTGQLKPGHLKWFKESF